MVADAETDLSFARWCRLNAERPGRVGTFVRWSLSGRRTDRPWGGVEAEAEYRKWFAEQSRSTAVRQVTDRLSTEAARGPSRPLAAPITDDAVFPAIVDCLWEISELLDALVLTAAVERQPRLRSVARRIAERALRLRAGIH